MFIVRNIIDIHRTSTSDRIKRLEERLDKVEQKQLCADGLHKWIMEPAYANYPPYIRCAACQARPTERIK